MSVIELIAYALKIIATMLDQHAKNSLSREQLDLAIAALHIVPPPKG